MKKVINTFLAGLSTVLPVVLTLYILFKTFEFIDGLLGDWIVYFTGISIPGVGFIITVIAVYFTGLFTKEYIGQSILHGVEALFKKIPIIQIIYGGIKDLSALLTKDSKKNFSQVVKVHFPTPDQVSIGLITNESIAIDTDSLVAVFIPTTPNPSNGFLVYMKRSDLTVLDIPFDQAIKMVVSMGSIAPTQIFRKL